MTKLFPRRSGSPPEPEDATKIVDLTDENAGAIVEALGSETTRELLAAIYEDPAPATELADRIDTSLQNTNYHLDKLTQAGLITVGDTWYAEQGNEMKVYVPTAESVVLHAGDDDTQQTVGETLTTLLGAVGLLGVASVVVEWLVDLPVEPTYTDDAPADMEVADDAPVETEAADTVVEPTILPLVELGGWLTPGVFFFLSGLAVLAVVLGISLLRRSR